MRKAVDSRMVRRSDAVALRIVTGERLSGLMADHDLTFAGLAAKLGILESTLANFHEGFRSLPSEVIASMATVLGTNVGFLLGTTDDARPAADIAEAARLRDEARRDAAG